LTYSNSYSLIHFWVTTVTLNIGRTPLLLPRDQWCAPAEWFCGRWPLETYTGLNSENMPLFDHARSLYLSLSRVRTRELARNVVIKLDDGRWRKMIYISYNTHCIAPPLPQSHPATEAGSKHLFWRMSNAPAKRVRMKLRKYISWRRRFPSSYINTVLYLIKKS